MTTDLDTIVQRYDDRRMSMGLSIERMREMVDHYEGRVDVVLPQLDKQERPAVPNLYQMGVDQVGSRIASTVPDVRYEPLRPGIKRSMDLARRRRLATLGWVEESEMEIKLGRRARWFVAYGCSPVLVRPDRKLGIPRWHLRNPLATYPASMADPDDMTPDDCIFDFTRSLGWLERNYPDKAAELRRNRDTRADAKFTCIEFIDHDEIVMAVIGQRDDPFSFDKGQAGRGRSARLWTPTSQGWLGTSMAVELERTANYAGVCTAVVPGRITLDERLGQFDGMVGMYQVQAKLMALELNAVSRGIYPDTWMVARQNENVEIVTVADGLRGVIGEVKGADIKTVSENPGYQTRPTIDALERNQRVTAGIPAEFGGEGATNVRTGRRGDQILSATVDFTIQEAQRVTARSVKHEVRRGIAVARGYFGTRKLAYRVGWDGNPGADYRPVDIFEDGSDPDVTYAHPGADINNLVVGIGQRLGEGLISEQTGRELDPLVDDPEKEKDRIVGERLTKSVLVELEQPGGLYTVVDKSRIAELVVTNRMELFQAVAQVQQEAQARQASSGPPGTPEGPVAPGSPEAQPGLAPPGAGVEQPTIAPSPNEQGLSDLVRTLRAGARPPMAVH